MHVLVVGCSADRCVQLCMQQASPVFTFQDPVVHPLYMTMCLCTQYINISLTHLHGYVVHLMIRVGVTMNNQSKLCWHTSYHVLLI